MPSPVKTSRGIQSVEVGGRLLLALVAHGAAMSLSAIAEAAGMPPSKAHPYLVSFGKLGLTERDPVTGNYGLGPLALHMGLISLQGLDPVRIAMPKLVELAAATGQTVALATWGSHGPTIVYILESSRPIHVNMRTGTVMSMLGTATGQVFAAHLPRAVVEARLAREAGDPDTVAADDGKGWPARLDEVIAEVRQRGLARVQGAPIPGVSAFSAPVFDHHKNLRLAITVLGPSGSFDAAWRGSVATRLRACADAVSYRLGAGDAAPA